MAKHDDEIDETQQTPPSSLDLDRSASAARSGRSRLHEHSREQHDDPLVAAGDPDADARSASVVGDETPGGDNPTPDQSVADDIGRAIGLEYQDNEELRGEEKVSSRDRQRWELNPASSEDFKDR
jgi:hypothetical protein